MQNVDNRTEPNPNQIPFSNLYCRAVGYNSINVKKWSLYNGYRRRSWTYKTAKIHRFVRFVIYCIITTVPLTEQPAGWEEGMLSPCLHPGPTGRRASDRLDRGWPMLRHSCTS